MYLKHNSLHQSTQLSRVVIIVKLTNLPVNLLMQIYDTQSLLFILQFLFVSSIFVFYCLYSCFFIFCPCLSLVTAESMLFREHDYALEKSHIYYISGVGKVQPADQPVCQNAKCISFNFKINEKIMNFKLGWDGKFKKKNLFESSLLP